LSNFYRNILLFVVLTSAIVGKSQQQNIPLNREFGLVNHKVFNSYNSNVHTSFQPINQSFIRLDTIDGLSKSEQKHYLINISKPKKKSRNFFKWMYCTMFFENFLVVDTGKFYLTVDPLLNIEMGKDVEDTASATLYKNTRGVIVRGNVGEKFSFETSFYENQAVLPEYQTEYADETGVIPGQGRWKRFKSNQGYDFSSASANISYTPTDYINFQLGTGKNFIGDGYRSLLLSDASFNYPFWKITTTFGKKDQFQYTKLNASLSSITRREKTSTAEALFTRKTMSTHYFSWLATKWLNIGLFEATLWQTEDSNGTKPLQYQQFNPIIGVNTATTGFNDVNHSVIGTNLKIKLPFKMVLYNQLIYDGPKKHGYQFGIKYFGINNLTLQVEYNNLAPYTYSSSVPLQAYSNYNEPLAHPSGANFDEFVGVINYKYKRFFTQFKFVYSDVAQIDVFSGGRHNFEIENRLYIQTADIHIGYLINPKNNMSITLGYKNRFTEYASSSTQAHWYWDHKNEPIYITQYIYFGFRTSLRNLYSDF